MNYQAAYKQWRDWMMLKWLFYMRLDGLFKLRYIKLIILNFILNKKSVSTIKSALYSYVPRLNAKISHIKAKIKSQSKYVFL